MSARPACPVDCPWWSSVARERRCALLPPLLTLPLCPLLFVSSVYAFSAFDNHQLQYLWDWSQHNLTIKTGKLFFRANPKLCMSEIHKMWEKTGIQGRFDESEFRNNGDRASCRRRLGLTF